MKVRRLTWFSLVCVLVAAPAWAEVKLPAVFGSHMVLQQDRDLPVWGWATPGENVQVQCSGQETVATVANDQGEWKATLKPMKAGGPLTLTVTGTNTLVLEDVLVGEVWIGSGQSNMEWPVSLSDNADQEIANANFPQIRLFHVPKKTAGFPAKDVEATWQVCAPETVKGFSACLYFMGRELHKQLSVPMGLINSSWGGTRIEPWTPPVGFAEIPVLQDIYNQVSMTDPRSEAYKALLGQYLGLADTWLASARQSLSAETPLDPIPPYPAELTPFKEPHQPSTLYNGMIHPLIPFAIRGAIWYQGESNHGEGMLYTEKMKALIKGWRQLWGEGDFPFYYVQIAPFHYNNEDPNICPSFWVAQAAAQSIPNTGMVIVHDVGNLQDIHPRNKQEVGRRLALWALAKDYGRKGLEYSGPTVRSMKFKKDKIVLEFDHAGSGLATRDGQPLNWFEIIGKDTDFVQAQTEIDGDAVKVWSPEIQDPVAARFAWHRDASPNLMNKEGLPAGAFVAGEVPDRDFLALKVPESKEYQLVYSLDLGKLGPVISYDVDRRNEINAGFDRIAYFLELQKGSESPKYVYVSMDAFTDDLGKIGLPTVASGAVFQQNVNTMNVVSNVEGIVIGNGLTGGNIEFWPYNYGTPNSANVPNADPNVYDFGDEPGDPPDGHGSMQIHNHDAKQTLLAINAWKAGPKANIGIGNSQGKTRDWTFEENASEYTLKRLRVLVHPVDLSR